MCKFRDLRADEIECRVQSCKKNGLILLLYKDARVDMNILDETVGASNWQREHYECKGNLFCRVGICVATEKGDAIFPEWVWKSDCGTESNTEAQKGEASDSFKRACFNWGIGRELYTSPFIWIPAEKCNIVDGNKCHDKFEVRSITIVDKKIVGLEIVNTNTKNVVFTWGQNNKPQAVVPPQETLYCTECGALVSENMAARTQKAFGVLLCKDCGLKRTDEAMRAAQAKAMGAGS